MELLTVKQATRFLQTYLDKKKDINHVYYLVRLCKLDSVRIRQTIRIPKGDLIDYVKRKNEVSIGSGIACNHGYTRRAELFAVFAKDGLQDDCRQSTKSVQGRRQRVEFSTRRSNRLSREAVEDLQLLLF